MLISKVKFEEKEGKNNWYNYQQTLFYKRNDVDFVVKIKGVVR